MTIIINYEKCCWKEGNCTSCRCKSACVGCVEACPTGALTRKDKLVVNAEKCTDCGACITACKHEAISFPITTTH